MKTNLLLTLLLIMLLSTSCSRYIARINEESMQVKNLDKTHGEGTFVILKDSSKVFSSKFDTEKKFFKKEIVTLENGATVKIDQIIGAKLDDKTFSARIYKGANGGFSNEAGGLDNGNFGTLISNGPFNIYKTSKMIYTSTTSPTTGVNYRGYKKSVSHYIQEGNGTIVLFSDKRFRNAVSDYEPSKEIMDRYSRKKTTLKAVGWLNTGCFFLAMSLGSVKSEKLNNDTNLYLGGGIAIGNIIYGFINRKFKRNNERKITDAYEEYMYNYRKVSKK